MLRINCGINLSLRHAPRNTTRHLAETTFRAKFSTFRHKTLCSRLQLAKNFSIKLLLSDRRTVSAMSAILRVKSKTRKVNKQKEPKLSKN